MITRPLRRTRILDHLGDGHRFAADLHVLGIVDSTSDLALASARDGAGDGAVVVAEGQRAGRGRRGTTWCSPARRGLWFSVVVKPPPADRRLLSPAVGLAVAEAIRGTGAEPQLKWPNDVFVEGGKVAGCLVDLAETQDGAAVAVVGVGINVNVPTDRLPRDPGRPAASLHMARGEDLDRESLLAATLQSLDRWLRVAAAGDEQAIRDSWAAQDLLIGAVVTAAEGEREVQGTVTSLDPLVGLEVQTADGAEHLRAEHARILTFEPRR